LRKPQLGGPRAATLQRSFEKLLSVVLLTTQPREQLYDQDLAIIHSSLILVKRLGIARPS
jgi:hypothetical protein